MSDIIERLRSTQPLAICPYDRKSPEYWTTPDDAPCKFCGGLPDGPDKCTGADTRIMGQAADEIERLRTLLSEAEQKLHDAKKIAVNAESYGYGHGLEEAAQLAKKMQDDALTDSAREHAGHFEETIREIQAARDKRALQSEER